MATTYRLILKYKDTSGSTITHNWSYAKSSPASSDVKDLMETTISNGDIFAKVPITKVSAEIEATTLTEINISD